SLPTFSSNTTADEVATALNEDIQGKNVLITGTSLNGIGFETVRVLARYANTIMITGYNSERYVCMLVVESVKREVPSADLRPILVDLSALASVRHAAAQVNSYSEPLHVLIHNAAAPIGPFKLTEDNFEHQMATNHIGPFLLTKLLAPKILAAKTPNYTPRVVFVSSFGHGLSGVNWRTFVRPDPAKYEPADAYFQAKAANVLCARELSRRSKGRINAYSLHPGAIAPLQRAGVLGPDGLPSGDGIKTIPQGAATTVVAAFDPRIDDHPGAYLCDCKLANELVSPPCADSANANKLWNLTEEVIEETFTFPHMSGSESPWAV
ncbi:NAD-P-binding protein, partial [Mycena galericulata]